MSDKAPVLLTREAILSAQMREMVRAADPTLHVLSDSELARSRSETLAGHPGGDLWVFAYGSLMWNPAFHHVERRRTRVFGYHRQFCLHTWLGRGTRDRPGLMLALVAGGSCSGMAYRIAAESVDEETSVIWRREMLFGSYMPKWVVTDGIGSGRRAIAFVINTAHEMYAGRMARSDVVRILATARGALGPASDYLYETVAALASAGIDDRELSSIAREVRAYQSGDA